MLVNFHNPHPGFSGCLFPIPKIIKELADSIDGKTMELDEVLEQFNALSNSIDMTVKKCSNSIILKQEQEEQDMTNVWRIICFGTSTI